MNRTKHVKIVISSDGAVSVDAVNFRGAGCKDATMEITAALGGHIEHEREKPEIRLREQRGQSERESAR